MALDLNQAFDKAMAETEAEATPSTPSTPETTSTTTPEPTKEAAPSQEETPTEVEAATEPAATSTDPEDDEPQLINLTAEDIALIKQNPVLAKAYKSFNKDYTKKTTALSQQRQLAEYLQNPETRVAAAKMIAAAAGLQIMDQVAAQKTPTEAKTEALIDESLEELNKVFDPAVSKMLKPILEKLAATTAKATLEKEIAPLREATGALAQEAYKNQSEAEVRAFKSAHPNEITPEVENKMAALFAKIPPSDNIEPAEYMEMLWKIVKADTKKTEAVKEVTTRMAKAAASVEPKTAVQPGRVSTAANTPKSMDYNQRFSEAWDEAVRGE